MTYSVYKSRIGAPFWLVPMLLILIIAAWVLVRPGWVGAILCMVFIGTLIFVLVASVTVYSRTTYTITPDSVFIDSADGPLNITFDKIRFVDAERDDEALYYGMSRDVVRINFGTASAVVISPKDKYRFLNELRIAGVDVKE